MKVNNLINRVANSKVSVSMSMIKLLHTQKFLIALLLSTIVFITACGKNESENSSSIQSLKTIDISEAYDNRDKVPLSLFAKSIEYIPLETNEESLIGRGPIFQATKEQIILSASNHVFVFSREDGGFIKEIGTHGEGPDESRGIDRYFNENTSITYVKSDRYHFGLTNEGEIVDCIYAPSEDSVFVMNFVHLTDSTFIGFHGNYNCNQKHKLIFFKSNGEIIKTIENQFPCELKVPNSFHFLGREGQFPKYRDKVWFKESFNDTLFEVHNDYLVPKAVINLGNRGIAYEDRINLSSAESQFDYFKVQMLDITENQLFFQLTTQGQTFNGIYNFETEETLLSDIGLPEMHGFVNDLDNFLPFVPQYATDNNQLVGYIEAQDVLSWFNENPEKAAQLPDHLKKLGDMKPDDNPVVMIVDLKN